PSPERRGLPATPCRPRGGGTNPHRRHRRRALPRPPAPHPAGRPHLHPRGLHDRRRRLPPRALRRPPPETPRRNRPPVRPPPRRRRPLAGNRRPLPLLARRAALPVPHRGPRPRPDPATSP